MLADHPVAAALAHLRSLADRATWSSPADLIAALVDERRLLDAVLDSPDGRDVWRRLRYVIEQARAWSDAGGHGLRRYLAWVRLQATESHTADTILPEHDHDAVRIMTIHAAKGLEFPITVVTGLTTVPAGKSRNSVVWHRDDWTIASQQGDEIYDDFKPIDEQMSDAERRRLLYVACTRAIDHLIVSLHRVPPKNDVAENRLPSGALLADRRRRRDVEPAPSRWCPIPGGFTVVRVAPDDLEWNDVDDMAGRTRSGDQRRAVAGSRSAPRGSPKTSSAWNDPGAGDRRRASQGRRRPRAPAVAARAIRHRCRPRRPRHAPVLRSRRRPRHRRPGRRPVRGGRHHRARVERRGARPLRARGADRAARRSTSEHHRELFVAAPIGDRVLEGYIDLLVRTDAGFVIVDYKTDAWRTGADRAERIARYRRQLAAYAVALEQVLGEPIVAGLLVHCRTIGRRRADRARRLARSDRRATPGDGSRRADRSALRRPASTTL